MTLRPSEIAAELRALIPQMREDEQCHRSWMTDEAQRDLEPGSAYLERHAPRDVAGDREWHERWAAFYANAAEVMERAADALAAMPSDPASRAIDAAIAALEAATWAMADHAGEPQAARKASARAELDRLVGGLVTDAARWRWFRANAFVSADEEGGLWMGAPIADGHGYPEWPDAPWLTAEERRELVAEARGTTGILRAADAFDRAADAARQGDSPVGVSK